MNIELLMNKNTLAVGALVISFSAGRLSVADVDHAQECAEEIIQGRDLLISRDQCLEDLAACRSSAAGGSVIKCEDSCDVRVQKALAEAAVWACGD
jgi:hypothetical protein